MEGLSVPHRVCTVFSPQGLHYIHSLGLAHLDIKPDNIFVSLPEQSLTISCVLTNQEGGAEEEERAGVENTQLLYKIGVDKNIYGQEKFYTKNFSETICLKSIFVCRGYGSCDLCERPTGGGRRLQVPAERDPAGGERSRAST